MGHKKGSVQETVENIIADVRDRGDAALVEYTNKFDIRNNLGWLERVRLQAIRLWKNILQ